MLSKLESFMTFCGEGIYSMKPDLYFGNKFYPFMLGINSLTSIWVNFNVNGSWMRATPTTISQTRKSHNHRSVDHIWPPVDAVTSIANKTKKPKGAELGHVMQFSPTTLLLSKICIILDFVGGACVALGDKTHRPTIYGQSQNRFLISSVSQVHILIHL